MTVARGGETWSFIISKRVFQATQNLPPRQNLSFLSRGETPPAAQCESRMEPESAEVASRARDAARAAATASAEAATLEAAAEFERAALRARRDVSGARAAGRKTRVDVPRTPREAETRARRTREAAAEERRAREMARMRAAAARAASRGGNLSVRSAAALDAERRARWQTHEARWASFCRDDQASPLAAPFPASGEDLLLALQSVFLREDSDARDAGVPAISRARAPRAQESLPRRRAALAPRQIFTSLRFARRARGRHRNRFDTEKGRGDVPGRARGVRPRVQRDSSSR